MFLVKIILSIGIYGLLSGFIIGKLTPGMDVVSPTMRCPRDHFLRDNGMCQPFFGCRNSSLIKISKELESGYVKKLFVASWAGMKIVYSISRRNVTREDFIHGITMLRTFQHTPYVPQMIGYCTDEENPYLATRFYKYGSADKLKDVLDTLNLPPKKELETRFSFALDYLSILEFLHSSPVGTRVMCDSNDLTKTLSQYVITDDLRLVVADLDALPVVDHDEGIMIKCGHRQLFGNFVAPEQLWPYEDEPFIDSKMPGYDEMTDIWKIPNVLRFLLGQSNQANQFKFRIFEILRLCKEVEPGFRPNARYVKEAFVDNMDIFASKVEL